MTERHRIADLRRRVQQDPASLAFAQLAEELRREGSHDEAVTVCRAGLAHHPALLTARVTLGRALIELGRLDEAFEILTHVLHDSPANLPSMRAIAEIYQRRGLMGEALTHYRRAMELAQAGANPGDAAGDDHDATAGGAALEKEVEALFDFDSLLAQLGGNPESAPLQVAEIPPAPGVVDSAAVGHDAGDELAIVERQLRDRELRLTLEAQARQLNAERRRQSVQELERWLAAVALERQSAEPHA